jgi:hypothetical protein
MNAKEIVPPEVSEMCQKLASSAEQNRVDTAAIEHFVKCARRGASRGSSNGERVANKLARGLQAAADDICILDYGAIDGFCELVRCLAGPWPDEAARNAVFAALRRAAQ